MNKNNELYKSYGGTNLDQMVWLSKNWDLSARQFKINQARKVCMCFVCVLGWDEVKH